MGKLVALSRESNKSYNNFVKKLSGICNIPFPKTDISIKQKDLNNPWIIKGLRKSSRKAKTI